MEIKELSCPTCGSHMIQIERVRYEKAFYYCLCCGISKEGSESKSHFLPKRFPNHIHSNKCVEYKGDIKIVGSRI